MRFFIANIIPGSLLATPIARTRYYHNSVVLDRTERANRLRAWLRNNGRLPSVYELHKLWYEAPGQGTTISQTITDSYLQCFDDWWVKFAYWTCDLIMSLDPRALIHLVQQCTGDSKQSFFGHTTAFSWPAWLNYAPLLFVRARPFLFCSIMFLLLERKSILKAVKRYFVSWGFVDRLVWAGITYWLSNRT
jgi:hypothetical protein